MILYPAIDIRGGRAVRLTEGDYARETAYDADPLDAALRWVDGGATWLHVVDLDGARAGEPVNLSVIRRIAQHAGAPLQCGGGVRDLKKAAALFDAGAERVILGTAALSEPEFAANAVAEWGERIAVSVDARAGMVALRGWTETSTVAVFDAIDRLHADGVSRFVYTEIERDGTLDGIDAATYGSLCDRTSAAVIASGGVGSLDDLRALSALARTNLDGAIVGKALYEGRFTVPEALAELASVVDG